jgi:hypothetical protein
VLEQEYSFKRSLHRLRDQICLVTHMGNTLPDPLFVF